MTRFATRRTIIGGLCVAVLIVVVAALGYGWSQRTQAWELGDQEAPRIVAFGDSYVAGDWIDDREAAWVPTLARGVCRSMSNWGVAGDMARETLDVVRDHGDEATARDVVVVQTGLNDLRRHGEDPTHLASFGEDLGEIVEAIPEAEVVLVAADPIRDWDAFPPFDEGSDDAVALYNAAIEDVAADTGATYVPVPSDWSVDEDIGADGVHPSEEGHAALAGAAAATLSDLNVSC